MHRRIALLGLVLGFCCQSALAADITFTSDRSGVSFANLDMTKIANEDAIGDSKQVEGGYRFAIARDLAVNPTSYGRWSAKADGRALWTFDVTTSDAAHLNFGFNPFHLPPGAVLTIRSTDGTTSIGPFTEKENAASNQFWTPVLLASSAVLELSVPAGLEGDVQLNLVRIGQGYRGFGATAKHCKSGACNTDVVCLSAGDPWNAPRRSVGAYTRSGTDTCTGSLLNNTANDRRMLFATASHCGIDTNAIAAQVVVYWNYESPTCRRPGSSASGTIVPRPSTTQNGGAFIAQTQSPFAGGSGAGNTRSDWTLIELEGPANPAYNLFWAGWDRRELAAPCAAPLDPTLTTGLCASIHHPAVDEKRITFSETNMTTGNISAGVGVHWRVAWDATPPQLPNFPAGGALPPSVTERGSSGSPLYNANQHVIGVLSGGASFCGATGASLTDEYGKLSHAWEGTGTTTTAMKAHLDPVGGGSAEVIDGIGQCIQPAAPANVTATATAPNTIAVSWAPVSGISTYRLYRSNGTCPGTTFAQIAEVGATSYNDTSVSGGSSYSYKVTAVDTAQPCESTQSICAGATATGVCNLPPTFAGLTTASSAGASSCGVNLGWSAASPNCGAGGQIRYNIFRSSTPGFTPSAANAIQTCVTATSAADNAVGTGQQFYVVRAEDSNGSGTGVCAAGLQDSNTSERAVTPAGPDTVAFSDNAETGPSLWTVAGSGAGSDFALTSTQARSPTQSWFVSAPSATSSHALSMASPVAIPNATGTTLEFFHRYNTEASYDGGILEYSLDGTTWSDILAAQGAVPANANRFISGGYNGAMNASGAFGARAAWHGAFNTTWLRTAVNLADFNGLSARFRFRSATDSSVTGAAPAGWWIDDIRLFYGSSCSSSLGELIFRNGFDSAVP